MSTRTKIALDLTVLIVSGIGLTHILPPETPRWAFVGVGLMAGFTLGSLTTLAAIRLRMRGRLW